MAVLSPTERLLVLRRVMEFLCNIRQPIAVTKPDLLAAVNAADQWCEDNAASFNLALPIAARTNLTAKQKAHLLAYVAIRRFEI